MTEQILLIGLLCVASVFGPLMTNRFFLSNSRVYSLLHKITLVMLAIAAVIDLKFLVIAWPLFCAIGLFLYLKTEFKLVLSLKGIASCIPFIFSLIASLWLTAGILDLRLLGYNQTWSFYAALHGCFLGWILVGCFAFLAKRKTGYHAHLIGCYLIFILFLFVAFGIDGTLILKRIGVIGLSLVTPLLIGIYAFNLDKRNTTSRRLSILSLVSILSSMALALLKEFGILNPEFIAGIPVMVLAHGFLNAVIVVPCFYLAIRFEQSYS